MNSLTYNICHTTRYEFSSQVTEAEHLTKLQPRDLPIQRCHHHALSVTPDCALKTTHIDYFGNHCALLTHREAFEALEIKTETQISRRLPFVPAPEETPPWEHVRARILTDRSGPSLEAIEFTYDSELIATSAPVQQFATESFQPRRPLLQAAQELTERIYQEFQFDPTATTTSTAVSEILDKRRGVCQDFAHLQIACFRSLGLAARYVSGYLETDPPPGGEKLVGADASHAWTSLFSPEIGWIDLDPTNGCVPSLRHLTIGWGRDYADVCPVRGVIKGGGTPILQVAVDVIASDGQT